MHTPCNRSQSFFVGVDSHKDSHTAVALSPFGEELFELKIGPLEKDFNELSERVKSVTSDTGLSPYVGLEDCHEYGARLASFLNTAGYPVFHVASTLVEHARKRTPHPEKSDAIDAKGAAQVMIQRIDTLPQYTVTKSSLLAKDIRELSRDREHLVKESTILKNQLHTLLYRILGAEYQYAFKDPFAQKALRHWMKLNPKGASSITLSSMKRKIKSLRHIREQIDEIKSELETLVLQSQGKTLVTTPGIGTIHAAEIVGEIGDITKFKSPGALAKYAGCAPRECSSGKSMRHYKTKSGNRKLNKAVHLVALAQVSPHGTVEARDYFEKKIKEGKSKAQALVCLRRHLLTSVWNMMKRDENFQLKKKSVTQREAREKQTSVIVQEFGDETEMTHGSSQQEIGMTEERSSIVHSTGVKTEEFLGEKMVTNTA